MSAPVREGSMRRFWESSQLAGHNADFLEALYEQYLKEPDRVSPEWRAWFEQLPQVNGAAVDISHARIREQFRQLTTHPRPISFLQQARPEQQENQVRVLQLINAYRFRGHQRASLDPLHLKQPEELQELSLAYHGLDAVDLDTQFDTGSLFGPDRASLRDIIRRLESTYCGSIGSEYMHITETGEKRWIQQRLESDAGQQEITSKERLLVLNRLTAAEGLERFLHNRYVGQKRFSLEGADSLIPLLDTLIHRSGKRGIKELVIGMAHRGRLNVLVNLMGKSPDDLFREFEGKAGNPDNGSGDVKYHKGFSSEFLLPSGMLHVALAFNPSHLEIVNPVVEGSVRARQERRDDTDGKLVLPVLLHGDAAFAGQGVVMETLNLSKLNGYATRGTVHVVINNQIGFTTSLASEARSTQYCTDVAKIVDAPIFHVNGDDPEAVVFVTKLALDYRMAFGKDVVIDLVCYRRHGHSEADEPTATQPQMYSAIKALPTTRTLYAQQLVEQGLISPDHVEKIALEYQQALTSGTPVVPYLIDMQGQHYRYAIDWKPYLKQACTAFLETHVPIERLREVWQQLEKLPTGFTLHNNVGKVMDNRRKMLAGAMPIDWGCAETLAYATLLTENYSVRLSGQDSARGTFFHRHAVLHNQDGGNLYTPLQHVAENQGDFAVINSPLSEAAVLAFEYGYATADPKTLVIWEAQFGDFANNAQVVIDQFISAGEQKWNRLCGLVMFLPHGYEGQGPEHSSARLERYLQLCAEQNIQVCQPTTPAQIFHLLRRQMLIECRKPLVVMTPKSLLRNRLAVNGLDALTQDNFHPLISETDDLDPRHVRRIVLCSGKVYYDLIEKRRQEEIDDVAIIRIEMLYPFPETLLRKAIRDYNQTSLFIWCQDEPKNQGAWFASQHHIRASLPKHAELRYAGRPFSAAPAVGYPAKHVQQQHRLVADALGIKSSE